MRKNTEQKKQKCKNCEGKGTLKKGDRIVRCQRCGGTGCDWTILAKNGVHKASFYDPEINRSYGMMAAHYGIGVLPARPRKPRAASRRGCPGRQKNAPARVR
jgi:RecJ-like exonuclease